MSRYLQHPHLPDDDILALAIGECYFKEFAAALEARGIEPWPLKPLQTLDPRLQGHADLMLLHLGSDVFWAAAGLEADCRIPVKQYVPMDNDCALNCCAIGPYWIGSIKYSAWQPADAMRISVKQRYARCSVCIVDDHSIITADHGIARRAKVNGIDVLEITPGHILLDGFNYGFIGGASFKIAPDKLAFTGTLHFHPDEERILGFLRKRKIEPVYLKDMPPRDIGSAVLIRQK